MSQPKAISSAPVGTCTGGEKPASGQSSVPSAKYSWLIPTLCLALMLPGDYQTLMAESLPQDPQPAAAQEPVPKLPPEQLDSLVAPIALYPDPLLSQTLVAATYPLEVIQLQQWLVKNPKLKDKELAEAVKKQPWDPSIQAMAALPDVVKRLADDIQWTTDLGNAFLDQQSDVMDAVQRMRQKAQEKGSLKSSEQVKVETKVVESKQVIVVEQSNPQVVYVPSYNPTVVYGPPPYPYPPVYYPPPPPVGYYAATAAISFGVGVAMGAMWGGGWGYNCGWHGGGNNNITINNNNNFVNNSNRANNISGGNRVNGGNSNWQHNPQHRGGAPYNSRATANQYGGTARGDSSRGGNRAGASNRGASAGSMDRGGAGGGGRGASAGTMDRGGGGGDRVGNRSTSSGGSNRSAFGGGSSGGFSGSSARSSSSRGSSSFGGGGGGGGSRGGGGGSRGGGGGRRR